MKTQKLLLSVLTLSFFALFSGCASESDKKIVRTSRPEYILLKKDITFGKEGGMFHDMKTVHAGIYRFAWEDKTTFYYENTEHKIIHDRGKNRVTEAFGALELLKRYDYVFVCQYLDPVEIRALGAGELIVMMLPKRGNKIVSTFGGIGGEAYAHMEFVGSVPLESPPDESQKK